MDPQRASDTIATRCLRYGFAMPTYFISFRSYGTWLHGSQEGCVDDGHNKPGEEFLPPNPMRHDYAHSLLKHEPVMLNDERRWVVRRTIEEVCAHRGWTLLAINVRTTHVHTVVRAEHEPERVINDFKAWCTRRMVERGVVEKGSRVWATHGSTRWLHGEGLAKAIDYVLNQQGPALPEREPGA